MADVQPGFSSPVGGGSNPAVAAGQALSGALHSVKTAAAGARGELKSITSELQEAVSLATRLAANLHGSTRAPSAAGSGGFPVLGAPSFPTGSSASTLGQGSPVFRSGTTRSLLGPVRGPGGAFSTPESAFKRQQNEYRARMGELREAYPEGAAAQRKNGGSVNFAGSPTSTTATAAKPSGPVIKVFVTNWPGDGNGNGSGGNGGNGNGGGGGKFAGAAAAVWGATKAAAAVAQPFATTMQNNDYLALRTMASTGLDRTSAARMNDSTSRNSFLSDADRIAGTVRMNDFSGYTAGSSGYTSQTEGARLATALDPRMSYERAVNATQAFSSADTYNRTAMMTGVQTIDSKGNPASISSIAQGLLKSVTENSGLDTSKPLDRDTINAMTGQNGSLRKTMSLGLGLGDDQQQMVVDYLKNQVGKSSYTNDARTIADAPGSIDQANKDLQSTAITSLTDGLTKYSEAYRATIEDVAIPAVKKLSDAFNAAASVMGTLNAGNYAMNNTPQGQSAQEIPSLLGALGVGSLLGNLPGIRRGRGRPPVPRPPRPPGAPGGNGALAKYGPVAGLAVLGYAGIKGVQGANSEEGQSLQDAIKQEQRDRGQSGALSGVNAWLKSAFHSGLGSLPIIGQPIRNALGTDKLAKKNAKGTSAAGDGAEHGPSDEILEILKRWDKDGLPGSSTGARPGSPSSGTPTSEAARAAQVSDMQTSGSLARIAMGYAQYDKIGTGDRPVFPHIGGGEIGDAKRETASEVVAALKKSGIPHRVTSTHRNAGPDSYHSSGQAVDVAGPSYAPEGSNHLLRINKFLARTFGSRAEQLIYSGPGATNMEKGSVRGAWGGATHAIHKDHVHIAVAPRGSRRGLERGGPRALETGSPTGAGGGGTVSGKTQGLEPVLMKALQAMAAGEGISIVVTSGRRDTAEQTVLYQRYLAGKGPLAAKPGTSQHEKGLAADIAPGRSVLGNEVAAKYGLAFTVASEDWHIEPIGGRGMKGTASASDASSSTTTSAALGASMVSLTTRGAGGGGGAGPYSERAAIEGALAGGGGGINEGSVLQGGSPVTGTATDAGAAATSGGGGGGGTLGALELAALAKAAGFKGEGLIDAVAVALAESQGVSSAISPPNKDKWGSRDRGLWQINDHWHPEVKNPLNPAEAAAAAFKISGGGSNWKPWSTWANGAAKGRISAVRQALKGFETGDVPMGSSPMGAELGDVHAMSMQAPAMLGGGGGGGNGAGVSMHMSGGGVHIARVEVHITTPQVSHAEASRIGKMVVDQIARQAKMKEMSR